MAKTQHTVVEAAGREVVMTNPDKIFFPRAGHTKLDLAKYYAAVAEGALRGIAGRPIVLKRYVDGAEGEPFFQKRAPELHPDWVETVELRFPSGNTAREIVVRDAAQLLWIVNLGCIDLNPTRCAPTTSSGIDDAAGSLDALLELSAAQEAAGLGDAPWPPNYRKQSGEAAARRTFAKERCEWQRERQRPQAVDATADHRRQGAAQGGRARGPGALEGAPSRGRGAAGGGRCPHRLDARPIDDVDAHPREPPTRSGRPAPGRGTARSRLRSLARLAAGE